MSSYPVLKENEGSGNYRVVTWPTFGGSDAVVMFNQTWKGPEGEFFRNKQFRIALSHAIDRDAIKELAFFGLGESRQGVPAPFHPYYPGDEYAFRYTELNPSKSNQILAGILPNKNSEGLEIKQTSSLDQTRTMCEINMKDIFISDDEIMIGSDSCINTWEKVKNISLGYLAMEQVGGAQACLDMSTQYAKERIQFGRPIGSFQAIQHICANMLVQLESAKSVAYSAVRTDTSDDLEVEMSAMLAKSYCSEVFNKIAGDNIQVHGGIGFTWEHPAHLFFKKAKSDSLLLGTPKLARDKIAELLSL